MFRTEPGDEGEDQMRHIALAGTVALEPKLDPSDPGVQLFEECLGSCPFQQHDNDCGMWMSRPE